MGGREPLSFEKNTLNSNHNTRINDSINTIHISNDNISTDDNIFWAPKLAHLEISEYGIFIGKSRDQST